MRSSGWLGARFDSQPVDDLIPDGMAERQHLAMLICQSPRALAAGCIACRVLMVLLQSLSSSSSIVKHEAMRQVRQRSYHYFCDSDMHQLTLNEDHNNDPNLFQQVEPDGVNDMSFQKCLLIERAICLSKVPDVDINHISCTIPSKFKTCPNHDLNTRLSLALPITSEESGG